MEGGIIDGKRKYGFSRQIPEEIKMEVVRLFYQSKENSCVDIAKQIGIHQSSVNHIVNRHFEQRKDDPEYLTLPSKMNYENFKEQNQP